MRFLDLLESMGLQQHVDVPTHKSGHTLDLIITRRADSLLTDPMADYLFSDHFLVISDLITESVKKPSVTVKRYRTGKRNMSTMTCLLMTCESQLCANTVPIVCLRWSIYTTHITKHS